MGQLQVAALGQIKRAADTVCGDLTEVFDFRKPMHAETINTTTTFTNGTNPAAVPSPQTFPALPKPVTRVACPLGYEFFVQGQVAAGQFSFDFANTGSVGAAFIAYWMPMSSTQAVFHYTVEAGKSLAASAVSVGADGLYDWAVHGPNGFLREFRGNARHSGQVPEVTTHYDASCGHIRIKLDNRYSSKACLFKVSDNAYYQNRPVEILVPGGFEKTLDWVGSSDVHDGGDICSGWYDVSIRIVEDAAYFRRVAGCVQRASGTLKTDPAMGNPQLFKPSFSVEHAMTGILRFDYVTPPWHHRPLNWIGVFKAGVPPTKGTEVLRVNAPRGIGSAITSVANLSLGWHEAWYFFDNGYMPISGPVPIMI